MKTTKYLVLLLTLVMCVGADAKKKHKTFYDAKSNIIGITGDYDKLSQGGINKKFFNNNIGERLPTSTGEFGRFDGDRTASQMNREGVGKKVLDLLLMRSSGHLSYDLLRERALANAQLADEEIADASFLDTKTLLSDDILPILLNNFIYLEYDYVPAAGTIVRTGKLDLPKSYTGKERFRTWILLKVDITPEIIQKVEAAWNDMAAYDQITVPVCLVKEGQAKRPRDENKDLNKVMRELQEEVPVLAVRGQALKGRRVAIGSVQGVRSGDRLDVYRQTQQTSGSEIVSERIGIVRAAGVKDYTTHYCPIAGKTPSYKRGDMLVWNRDHRTALGIVARQEDHAVGVGVEFDHMLSFNRAGISTHFLLSGSCSLYEKFNKRLYKTPDYGQYLKVPGVLDFGGGFGVGINFNHFQLMPYAMIQWENIYMYGVSVNVNGKDIKTETTDDYIKTSLWRMPLGVRLNVNLSYPLQLMLGAEYNFKVTASSEDDSQAWSYDHFKSGILDPMDYTREGPSFYAGLRFCF